MNTAQIGKRITRRVSLHIPVECGAFLDLVCKFTSRRKGRMVAQIWEAGMISVFGISPEQLEQTTLTVPRATSTDPSLDLKELTRRICGGVG